MNLLLRFRHLALALLKHLTWKTPFLTFFSHIRNLKIWCPIFPQPKQPPNPLRQMPPWFFPHFGHLGKKITTPPLAPTCALWVPWALHPRGWSSLLFRWAYGQSTILWPILPYQKHAPVFLRYVATWYHPYCGPQGWVAPLLPPWALGLGTLSLANLWF